MATAQRLHVVMVPYPIQGQINPMMQFAQLISEKPPSDADITVTIVHNKHNFDRLQQVVCTTTPASTDCAYASTTSAKLLCAASENGKVQLTWVENGVPPDFNYDDLSGAGAKELFEYTLRMKEPLKQLLQSLKQRSPSVSCVLFGMLCAWAESVAGELGIPAYFFWTQSAAVFSIYYHIPLFIANGFFPFNKAKSPIPDLDADTTGWAPCIPGLPPLRSSSFPTLLQINKAEDDLFIALLKEQFGQIGRFAGVIINSFEELENDACQALREELSCPVSVVGPFLPLAFLERRDAGNNPSIGASAVRGNSDCIEWLDGRKQKHSVLYIAFGSMFRPSAEDLNAIAMGIKSSKQPYLWAIRPNPSSKEICDILPKDFVEDTKDFGLVISWAPQLQVLSHPSVGAFLTHCGWNSTLEAISMGMPMISLPCFLDQTTNSAFVCDFWKVGVALKRQEDGTLKSEDVERAVMTVLHAKEGLEMRERARKMCNAARQAVQNQGSSRVQTEGFIKALQHAVLL